MISVFPFFFPFIMILINVCAHQSWFVRLKPAAKIVFGLVVGAIISLVHYYLNQHSQLPAELFFVEQVWLIIFTIAWGGYWAVRIYKKK